MNWKVVERKVPGGKLLRIKVACGKGVIEAVRLEGDFFVHPEEGVAWMENALKGLRVEDVIGSSALQLQRLVEERHITIIGFALKDVVELLGGLECSGNDGD